MAINANLKKDQSFVRGLTIRSQLTDCPIGMFKVIVTTCEGRGDCAAVCMVEVFETNSRGQCVVTNEELCFGCTACLAQYLDHNVKIIPEELEQEDQLTIEELLA